MRILATYRDGKTATITKRVRVNAGWGWVGFPRTRLTRSGARAVARVAVGDGGVRDLFG